jgi:putative membrane protein
VPADAAPTSFSPTASPRTERFSGIFFRAPSLPLSLLYITGLSLLLGILAHGFGAPGPLLETGFGVFFLPAVLAGVLTGPVSRALGGKLPLARSFLLAAIVLVLVVPFLLFWRAVVEVLPGSPVPGLVWVVVLAQGPALWFRHLSLFGVSNPDHARSLPASLLQPVPMLVAFFAFYPPTLSELVAALVILLLGFLTSAMLLRAADRPLRREFDTSGVRLIRPLLDHVGSRDPQATAQLEEFFGRHAILADLRVTLVAFRHDGQTVATVALPTVHPGPFAAVGASDLPRKIDEALGPGSGVVFVPHTPCNHDLDLPSASELRRVTDALVDLRAGLQAPQTERASPLVAAREGSLARVQLLGDTALVLISQAPAPSDDIDYAVIDALYGRAFGGQRPLLAFVDAHNCYWNDEGDLTYGSPTHRALIGDIDAGIQAAYRAARPGGIRVGTATRQGYSVAAHGIGPAGIRALVVEAASTTTAYVLIDGNNLLMGLREKILEGLQGRVDAAEVLTTDNHVVHEVDGGINSVGERYPVDSLRRDVAEVVAAAKDSLTPVTISAGTREVPGVRVLGPAWTARLLTSLGDTLSVFGNAALTTFLLLVTSSVVVVALLT